MNDETLLRTLFARQRSEVSIQGVVVLAKNPTLLPVERVGSHAWLHRAEPGSLIDLTAVYLGYGVRNTYNSEWLFPTGLHES